MTGPFRRHGDKYAPIKNHFVAFLGEFIGTFLFLFFAFGGTQTAANASGVERITVPNVSQLVYVALVFGFSLAINVWVFFRISGGMFNPAVTLALALIGLVGPLRAVFIFVAQILGAIAAAGAVAGLTPGGQVTFVVAPSQGVSITQALFLEMFFTVLLVFTILMLAAEKTKATFVAPIGIGLALFVAELFGVFYTGGALNPARAFGPAVIAGFEGSQWLYWVGPLLGSGLSVAIYRIFKMLDYEDVNGNQDLTEEEERELAEKEAERERARKAHKMHKRRSPNPSILNDKGIHTTEDIEPGRRLSTTSHDQRPMAQAPVASQSHYKQDPHAQIPAKMTSM